MRVCVCVLVAGWPAASCYGDNSDSIVGFPSIPLLASHFLPNQPNLYHPFLILAIPLSVLPSLFSFLSLLFLFCLPSLFHTISMLSLPSLSFIIALSFLSSLSHYCHPSVILIIRPTYLPTFFLSRLHTKSILASSPHQPPSFHTITLSC